jgi:hypothetical protein
MVLHKPSVRNCWTLIYRPSTVRYAMYRTPSPPTPKRVSIANNCSSRLKPLPMLSTRPACAMTLTPPAFSKFTNDANLYSSQLTLKVSEEQEALSLVQLYNALGGGW